MRKEALDYAGDSFPGQEPEHVENTQPPQHDWNPVESYAFVYGNGQLHVSDQHAHDELASHAQIAPEHSGPIAVGRVHVDMGKATFEIQSNIHAQGLARVLKDYCKNAGWRWGGMTDLEGEPIGTGSEFAPVKSYYFHVECPSNVVANELTFAKKGSNLHGQLHGAVHLDGKLADVRPFKPEWWSAFKEWADDSGFQLCSGNDNVLKTIEDLEENNLYTPEWNAEDDHFMFRDPPDQRQPGGVYKCPECAQIFPNWGTYILHRKSEEPKGEEPDQDGKFPELDMDATMPAHFHEQQNNRMFEAAFPQIPKPEVIETPPGRQDLKGYGWRRPVVYAPELGKVAIGQPGQYHHTVSDNAELYGVKQHRGWVSVEPHPAYEGVVPEQRGLYMYSGKDHIPALMAALREVEPEAANLVHRDRDADDNDGFDDVWTGKVAAPNPKDMIPAAIPFLYDIEQDSITVGQPGQRQSDIPGKFTPGGIVEGTYEPGGKVLIRTQTNMPYTVRHMLELWYYNYPQLQVMNVNIVKDDGSTQKVASQDVGTYLKTQLAADPTAWKADRALRQAGGEVYIVGGAVRDAIMGKEPKDIDLMVTGLPADQVDKVLRDLPGRVDLTGKDFGVFRYKHQDHEVEIALPRRERSTGAGHQDFSVQADHTMKPEEDLYRRDFTANAIAVDTATGQIIDPYNGVDDIQSGALRTLNTKSLADDPLRTVRALVAASKHGLEPSEDTLRQMEENASGIDHLPKERIQAELDKLFAGKNPARGIELAHDTGVLRHIFPPVARAMGYSQNNPHHELELGDHLVNVLKRVAEHSDDPDLRLAGLLHDIGKIDSHWTECRDCGHGENGHLDQCPKCGSNDTSGHFYQNREGLGQDHETVGAGQGAEWMRNMKYPNNRIQRVQHLIQHHMFPGFNTEKGARRFLNKVGPEHASDLLALRQADQGGKSEYPTDPTLSVDIQRQLVDQAQQQKAPTSVSALAVNGRDLIGMGMTPGPEIGQVLERLVQAVVENPELNTKEALLGLAQAWTNGQS